VSGQLQVLADLPHPLAMRLSEPHSLSVAVGLLLLGIELGCPASSPLLCRLSYRGSSSRVLKSKSVGISRMQRNKGFPIRLTAVGIITVGPQPEALARKLPVHYTWPFYNKKHHSACNIDQLPAIPGQTRRQPQRPLYPDTLMHCPCVFWDLTPRSSMFLRNVTPPSSGSKNVK
jgi:hypothetical protein